MHTSVCLWCLTFSLGISTAQAAELFHDDFESGSNLTTPLASGYGWNGRNIGEGDALGVTTDVARSGTHSLKLTFAGNPSGEDAWSEQRFTLGASLTEIYLQWHQYFPSGADGLGPKWVQRSESPANNKMLRLWDDDYGAYRVKWGFSTYPTGSWGATTVYGNEELVSEYAHNGAGMQQYRPAAIDFVNDGARGRWVKITVRVKVDSGSGNGVMQVWKDDAMIINLTNIANFPTSGIGNYIRNGYLMGWSNTGFDATSSTYIDDFIIADAPIGIVKPSAPANLQAQ